MGKRGNEPVKVTIPGAKKRRRSSEKLRRINPRRQLWLPLPLWLYRMKDISSTSKLLYGRLWLYANERGEAWPAQGTLAKELGISEQWLRKHIRELEDFDLIHTRRRGLGQSAVYTFPEHPAMLDDSYDNHDDGDIPPTRLDPLSEPDDPLGMFNE